MKTTAKGIAKGPMAVKTGLVVFCLALGLAMVDARLAAVPLIGFLLVSLAAPFFPRFGFFAPIIFKGRSGQRAVALTFDDGPDPSTTSLLLDILERRDVKATFFVIGEKAAAHPALIDRIIRKGHLLGNHSFKHSTRIFFQKVAAVVKDLEATQQVLKKHGVEPLVYRPPVGIVTPRLQPALEKTGLTLVNFSNRPLDGGNRRFNNLSGRVLQRIQDGDIVLLHDRRPPNEEQIGVWLKEVEAIVDGIEKRRLQVVPLSDLIGMPIMKRG
ncbi:MAG: polysaccharide deacetylase family protein [Thermodesulfobacteriota bacterium]